MSVSIASIQHRLRQVARTSGADFQLVLIRFFQERLLFRLAATRYRNNLCLKGGALLYALEREKSRPTLDIDFLASKLRLDKEYFMEVFQVICCVPYEKDGVTFNLDSLDVQEIMERDKYAGLRIKVTAQLGNINQHLQIDIGIGDVITPAPVEMEYPTLLDMEAPCIQAYSPETVIAEKFEAMISLAEVNSRMKDFYDVYRLLQYGHYDAHILREAIHKTFQNRGTAYLAEHPLFTEAFASDPERQKMWKAFLKRSRLEEGLEFEIVMDLIKEVLEDWPIWKDSEF
ncbi:MAG: nucleotidyl transferase AbiEii/AbiGii toxin family protein [Haliscomenobacteraceae bacterium CHB4]|nr:hypothetical protein [Saprospiraceae bacterium]MCE7924255.1 nucleotidyl transferase AbiEii/AbiGii toxin family protein [Haliscomenobacteraceae bacterium CHB4]